MNQAGGGGGGYKRPQYRSGPSSSSGGGGGNQQGGRANYGQQQRREGQGSEQINQGSSAAAGYSPRGTSGGQAQQRPSAGGGRAGGDREPDPPILYLNLTDPYSQVKNLEKLKEEAVWKKCFSENQGEVMLHERPREPATWNKRTIPVRVNHFLVQGIPNRMYHYQVNCELIRAVGNVDEGSAKKKPVLKPGGEEGGQGQQQARRVPKDLVEAILKWLVRLLRRDYRHDAIASNFSSNLFTTKKLEDLGIPLVHSFTVTDLKTAGVIGNDIEDERAESVYRVTFQFANDGDTGGVIDTTRIIQYLEQFGTLRDFNFTAELKQTLEAGLNAILRNVPTFDFYSAGRSTIVPYNANSTSLGEGLMAWKGINMNIGMGWKPYMNLEVANAAMVMGAPVFQVLRNLLGSRRDPNPRVEDMKYLQAHLEKVKAFLKSTKVQYAVNGRRFTVTVFDVFKYGADDPKTRFDYNGTQVTVYEYFQRKYNRTLANRNGLLLMKSNGSKIPAELCVIKDGQSVNRKLTSSQTDKMLKFAKRDPEQHYNDTLEKFNMLGLANSPVLNGFGMQIPNGGMLAIENARVLVPPSVRYGAVAGNAGKVAHVSPTNGTWAVWKQDFNFYMTPQRVEKWGVLVVGCSAEVEKNRENYNHLKKFVQLMKEQGRRKGVQLGNDIYEEFDYKCINSKGAEDDNRPILVEILEQFKQESYEFVLVILPDKNSPLYGHVKHAAEIDVGILTQCVQLESVIGKFNKSGPSPSLVQNVLLKLNMKLGGINHVTVAPLDKTLASQFCTLLTDCPVLVIGADVTHPPPGSKKFFIPGEEEGYAPSYAAVTGSLNKTCMPYMTEVRAQRKAGAGAAEVIQDLEEIVKKMLKMFYLSSEKTTLPLKIIYFRDGVGDGQFKEVLHKEMWAIRRACQSIPKSSVEKIMGKPDYEPKITFITVQKRHKTRMFWKDDKIKNVPAGTVVDQEIVHSTQIDFFMVSHYGALGTSRPTRYHVLWDDSDFSLNEIQSFTFTLCHMFARCTKSVRMPAPTYYAHLAAERAKKLSEGFENKCGDPTIKNLNEMLIREPKFSQRYPMHFI